MMAAALADGTTVIENAAKEPHIVDLANFLNSMGANIKGAGTDTIRIFGVDKLHGGTYAIIPDQIEAGTYMAAVAACGGQVLVRGIIPKHMDCITAKLQECGVEVEEQDDTLLVRRTARLKKANVKTLPYPGFPTDMQPQIATLLALSTGTSTVTESIFENRFKYLDELARMGANVKVEGKDNNLLELIAADPAFNMTLEQLEACMDPARYTGRSEIQVTAFLKDVVQPILDANKELLGVKADISV